MSKLPQSDFDERRLKLLGQLLSVARQNLRYSYRDLASITGVSASQILRMESGEFDYSLGKFLHVCEALGLSVGIILEAAMFRSGPRKSLTNFDSHAVATFVLRLPRSQNSEIEKAFAFEDEESWIRWLVETLSEAVISLTLASNPIGMAFHFYHPFEQIRTRLVEFAEVRCSGVERHYERVATLKALFEDPYLKLRAIGILDDEILIKYLAWCREDEENRLVPTFECSWGAGHVSRPAMAKPAGKNDQKKKSAQNNSEKDLMDASEDRKSEVVKSQIAELLKAVRPLVAPKGMKAKLAEYLEVPQSRVSEWLSGKYEPSGEIALRIRNWVHDPAERNK